MLTKVRSEQRAMYRRFTEADDGDAVVPKKLHSPFGSHATADRWLTGCASWQAQHQRMTLDDAIEAVAQVMGVSRAVLLSRARAPQLTFARALVTRYAIRMGLAPLAEVERALGRRRSTLYPAITRYELTHPELFRLTLDQVNTTAVEGARHRDGSLSQHGHRLPTRRQRPRDVPPTVGRLCPTVGATSSSQSTPRVRATR